MCAIFGFVSLNQPCEAFDRHRLKKAGDVLRHRGPDNFGFHDEGDVFMANCRLSIIDIDDGNQPFYSEDGRICVVYNGEIYNYLEIREGLKKKGHRFETRSDTEVLLKAYMEYGKACVQRFNGMFSFAIYDKKQKRVLLYRDRYGVKPLFLYRHKDSLFFASEIKAFWSMGLEKVFDLNHLSLFLKFGYLPPPFTLFKNVSQLKPGHFLKVDLSSGELKEERWWSWNYSKKSNQSDADLIDEFYEIFKDATHIRTRSDVPFGAFLSGGVDSSMIVGQMSSLGIKGINTYGVSFIGTKFDESRYAKQVADLFKTRHKARNFDRGSLGLWERVLFSTDQPHADVSFLPTYQVSKLATEDVKVVLTGDGGDEVFAGYNRYAEFNHRHLNSDDLVNLFLTFNSTFSGEFIEQAPLSHASRELPEALLHRHIKNAEHWEPLDKALYLDFQTLLPGNNLVKPDRMGMAHSLEARAPFMDHRIVDFGFNLPCSMKTTKKNTRAFQKNCALRLLPNEIVHRPKNMFTVPITEWKEGSLYSMAKAIIQKSTKELLGPNNVENLLIEHQNKPLETLRAVRGLIAFQIWYAQHFESEELNHIHEHFSTRDYDLSGSC